MANKIRYKLLNQNLQSHNKFQWVLNEWKHTSGEEDYLCCDSWLHCYSHPLLAILLNPIHADIDNPLLFKCKVKGKHLTDNGLKEGWNNMKIVEQIDIPVITTVQKTAFAILCAKEVYKEASWTIWANNWLNNVDRTQESSKAVYDSTLMEYINVSDYMINAAYFAPRYAHDSISTEYISKYCDGCYTQVLANATVHHDGATRDINTLKLAKQAMKYK